MGGRMTVTLNSSGDVCAIQKAGGEGILSSDVMRCLRIASLKADELTTKIKASVSPVGQSFIFVSHIDTVLVPFGVVIQFKLAILQ
jgi:hypothetical protein